MYDHPLDENYRQMYLNAKAEKEGKGFNSSIQKNDIRSSLNQKMPSGIGTSLNNKIQDPLIRAEAEKKIREQR